MKSLTRALLALSVLSASSLSLAQASAVRFGSSLATGVAFDLRSTLGLSLTFPGLPYVSGTAPNPFDRAFPRYNVGGNIAGVGSIFARSAYVRAHSNVDGAPGARFARGSVAVENLAIELGPNIRITAASINSGSRVWNTTTSLLPASSATFSAVSIDVFGNHVSLNDGIAPNLHVLNDKGVKVTANEQVTSGNGLNSRARITTALHIELTNVPINGQFVSGHIYIGRSYAQLRTN